MQIKLSTFSLNHKGKSYHLNHVSRAQSVMIGGRHVGQVGSRLMLLPRRGGLPGERLFENRKYGGGSYELNMIAIQ